MFFLRVLCVGLLLLKQTYRGVASGKPPSTGIVTPVVGVWRVAKNSTALATCRPVILAFSRFLF
jgi:hypothetical protein